MPLFHRVCYGFLLSVGAVITVVLFVSLFRVLLDIAVDHIFPSGIPVENILPAETLGTMTEVPRKERGRISLTRSLEDTTPSNPFPIARSAGVRLLMGGWKLEEIVRFSATPLGKVRADEATVMIRVLEEVCLSREALMRIAENPPAFPLSHLALFCAHGFSEEGILRVVKAHRRYESTNAFKKLSGTWRDILEDEMYYLAQYVSIVSGSGINPAIIAGVLEEESRRGSFLGGCFYFPTGEGALPVRSIPGEPEAFRKVVAGINSTRNPRYRMPASYPVVSCPGETGFGGAMGFVQMLPSAWLKYEPEVRDVMGENKFVSPYALIPALHALAMYLRDNAASFHVIPSEVSIADAQLCGSLAAKYYAGRRWKMHDGEDEYGGRVCAFAQEVASRF